jgi:hypothetical protein
MVQLGVDFSTIITQSSLQAGLEYAKVYLRTGARR